MTPEYYDDPHTCPWCGTVEPNAFLLQNNHWVKPPGHTGYDWCEAHSMCIAMALTRDHVSYHTARLGHPILPRNSQPDRPTTKRGREGAIAELHHSIARAEVLWADRTDTDWLDAARRVLDLVDPAPPTTHAALPASEDAALF